MKWKILLAEDDQNFRYAIKELVPWETSEFEIVGEAIHGKQALEFMKKNSVDILLTDMDMPVMNGVELIREVKKLYPAVRILALSAYDDFGFVKESMKLGAEDYILKQDMDGDAILGTLREICGKQRPEQKKEQYQKELRQFLSGSKAELEASAEYFETLFEKKQLYIALYQEGELADLYEKLHSAGYIYRLPWDGKVVAIGDVGDLRSSQKISEKIRETVKKSREELKICMTGVSAWGTGIRVLPILMKQAQGALLYLTFHPEKQIAFYEECREKLESREKELRCSFEKIQFSGKPEEIEEICERLKKLFREKMPEEHFVNENLTALYQTYAVQMKISFQERNTLSVYEEFQRIPWMEDKIKYLFQKLKEVNQSRGNKDYQGENLEIRRTMEYIRKHYTEDISLKTVADHVGLSENYLSNLFKNEVGDNLTNYVNQLRIEQAKKLIATTSMKTYEIAEAVGYHSASYFSTIFRKITGSPISTYKNKHL